MCECANAACHCALWQEGAQTISVRPKTRLDFSEELCRCVPQRKHERVLTTAENGEPGVLAE